MKILNLYSGIGGNRKLWDKPLQEKFGNDYKITAIELNPEIAAIYKDFFPNDEVIITDAHEYLLEHFKEYDFIWSSPPCQTHSRINKNFAETKNGKGKIKPRYPKMELYQEIIFLDNFFEGKYCIENVIPYYRPLIPAQQYNRHLFWCNFKIKTTDKRNPPKQISMVCQKHRKKGIKSFIKNDNRDELAIKYGFDLTKFKNIYLNGNHSPGQLLRNCVDPEIGLAILNQALGIITQENTPQLKLEI